MSQIVLTRDQVRRVDELAVSEYRIPSIILMENAGRNAAELIARHYPGPAAVATLCGTGNNGGDGCVIARHLHNAGWTVRVLVTGDEAKFSVDMRTNFEIVRAMGIETVITSNGDAQIASLRNMPTDAVVVDALLGTGSHGEVREPMAALIRAANDAPHRALVAVDVPSGLDCETGKPSTTTIKADLTITFVAIKSGFLVEPAEDFLGRVEVADIGAPNKLISQVAAEDV